MNKLTQFNKLEKILDNKLNGNLTDYKKQVKSLTKYELVLLIDTAIDYNMNIENLKLLEILSK